VTPEDHPARLRARPDAQAGPLPTPGRTALGLGGNRDGLVHLPPAAAAGEPLPLMVVLHGAGSSAARAIDLMAALADEVGIVLVAPDSRAATWDVIRGGFGPDVAFLDRALERVFAACPVDPARVVLGGFSDGASYALSLGIGNGDLFTHLVAFSPGFAAPALQVGRPRVFVTHGVHDAVLPIDRCSRRLVPALRGADYDVTYEEFDGGHVVPPELARQAAVWVGGPAPDG
jgi:phospholipase/carboxylesterase